MSEVALTPDSYVESRLNDIRVLFHLLHKKEVKRGHKVSHRLQAVRAKFEMELDDVICRMENMYFNHYIKNKNVDGLKDEIEKEIYTTRTTMKALLPYMLLYNMQDSSSSSSSLSSLLPSSLLP
jgi:hypothetical protein